MSQTRYTSDARYVSNSKCAPLAKYNPESGRFVAGGPGYPLHKNPDGEKSKLPLIVAGVLGVAAIGVGLYFLLRKDPDEKQVAKKGGTGTGGTGSGGTGSTPGPTTGTTTTSYVPSETGGQREEPPATPFAPPAPRTPIVSAPPAPLSAWAKKNAIVQAAEAAWAEVGVNIGMQELPVPQGWAQGDWCKGKQGAELRECVNQSKVARWFCFNNDAACLAQQGDPPLLVYRFYALVGDAGEDNVVRDAARIWLRLYGNEGNNGEPSAPCNIVLTVCIIKFTDRTKMILDETAVPSLPWTMLNLEQRKALAEGLIRVRNGD
jgi:hypothetical protein